MSKQNKKLIAEIQNGLKQVDEGIAQLEMLEAKVENASTISIKEKYRQDMKREIKRLQRLRDIFRQNVNNPAIVESHKLVEARKRIETEMEKFRDHEKEYKSKRPTKAAMLIDTEIKGKFNYGSGSSMEGDYGDEGDGNEEEDEEDIEGESDLQDINIDKQWLSNFVSETLRNIMVKYDTELDKIQNKKTKGGQKKNRDKINALKAKKSNFQHLKDRAEELQISMDYLEPGKIRQLRYKVKNLSLNPDEDSARLPVLQEIDSLIELSEANRRSLPANNNSANQLAKTESENGRVQIEDLDVAQSEDIVDDDRPLASLRIGHILDAQDYLGTWHLSIVIDDGTSATSDQLSDTRKLHFLPFQKANRDEVFSAEDQARLAPAFSKQELQGEPETQLKTLQTYMENHLRKMGHNPATVQQNKQMRMTQQLQAKEESKGGQSRGGKKTEAAGPDRSQKQQTTGGTNASNQAQNAPIDRNTNGSGLQLQKGKVAGANSTNLSQQQKAASLAGGKSNQDDFKNKTRMTSGNAHQADQALYHGSADGDKMMSNGAPQSVQLKSASNEDSGSGMGSMMMPQQQPLFQDMPAFGSGQFLFNSGAGGSDQLGGANGLGPGSSSVLLSSSNGVGFGALGGLNSSSQGPQAVKDTSLSERKHNLDLLETSFRNILIKQDQEVIDPKKPVSVWEELDDYPRVPLYNRKENFSKFDLETLFFAFYYQQGTYQQYLAAVELKKKNWKFVKKFETWFKKVEGDPSSTRTLRPNHQYAFSAEQAVSRVSTSSTTQQLSSSATGGSQAQSENGGSLIQGASESETSKNAGANVSATNTSGSQSQVPAGSQQKDVGKYIFFDFENGWQQLVRDDFELDLSQIENELVVQPAGTATQAAGAMNANANGGALGSIAPNNPAMAATATGYTGAQASATNAGSSGAPSRTTHQQ